MVTLIPIIGIKMPTVAGRFGVPKRRLSTLPVRVHPAPPHYTAVYGDWVDGEKAAYRPFHGNPTDYYGVETRTEYRYKHN